MIRGAQILVLKLGRLLPFRILWKAVYRLVLEAAASSLKSLMGVRAVLLRGSATTGNLVPGLSDIDFEVLIDNLEVEERIELVVRLHQRSRALQKIFPFVQPPFVRSATEWEAARRVPHEWLTHSSWRVVRGTFPLEQPHLSGEQEVLALFRLCFRELTKSAPKAFLEAADEGKVWPVRLNLDRIRALSSLSALIGQTQEEVNHLMALERKVKESNFLSSDSSQIRMDYLLLLHSALERFAPSLSELGQEPQKLSYGADSLQEPEALLRAKTQLRKHIPAEVELWTSNCGNRFAQFKLYVVPPENYTAGETADLLAKVRVAWTEFDGSLSDCCLSYPAPILLSRKLLPLASLSFSSCFEGTHLHLSGQLEGKDKFLSLAVQREMVDGVYLLRKKIGMWERTPHHLYRYLQDYFVGVYPALYLYLEKNLAVACPIEAARLFTESADSEYSEVLRSYLESPQGVKMASWDSICEKPLQHHRLLEDFHASLMTRHSPGLL